jgi:hypothetical protein
MIAGLVSVLLLAPRSSDAQPLRLYAGVSGMWSTQSSQTPRQDPAFPRTTVGGSAPGGTGEFGGDLTAWLGLTADVSLPSRFDAVQETDYSFSFRAANRHRDIVMSGLFHVRLWSPGRARLAVIAGPAVIREETLQRTAFQSGFPPHTEWSAYGPETSLRRWTVGMTAGLELACDVAARVQVVPQLRVHVVQRASEFNDSEQDSVRLGLGSVIWRPAVGFRVRF